MDLERFQIEPRAATGTEVLKGALTDGILGAVAGGFARHGLKGVGLGTLTGIVLGGLSGGQRAAMIKRRLRRP